MNKEQGIEWIKKERLPAFLESDVYLEYRLSKLISQAQPTANLGEVMSFKVDETPNAVREESRKAKAQQAKEEEEKEEAEVYVHKIYCSLGYKIQYQIWVIAHT